jgi:SAM-dependent methyltransferase
MLREKLLDILQQLWRPLSILWIGIYSTFSTIYDLIIIERRPTKVLDFSLVKSEAFARTWALMGPAIAAQPDPRLADLIAGSTHGIVVEIGPGSGHTAFYYTAIADAIKHIYFIEPNTLMHGELREKAISAGLDQKFTIVTAGAENCLPKLKEFKIGPGSIDTIIAITALCSAPNGKVVARELQSLLKPGGSVLLWEHVANHKFFPTRVYQGVLNLIWPYFMGDCQLTCETDKNFRDAGKWQTVDLKAAEDQPIYAAIPFIYGRLVKA